MIELGGPSIVESFLATAERAAQKRAMVYLGETFTFGALRDMVLRFAASLHAKGLGHGDRVVLYLYNLPQTLIAFLALQRIGATVVPVAPVYGAHDLRYLLRDSEARAILSMDSNFSYVREVLPETSVRHVVITTMMDLLPVWKKALLLGFDRVSRGRIPSGENITTFRAMLSGGDPRNLPAYRSPDPEDIALLLYTGGTTGFPKGVPIAGGLYLDKLLAWRRASEAAVPEGTCVSVLAAPLYHIIGQMDAMAPLVAGGEPLIVMPRVMVDAILDHVARYRATNLFAVPALYRMILEHDRLDFYDLSSLKYCGVGGDVLPSDIAERWLKKYGKPLYQGYGTTEFCGAITLSYVRDGMPPVGSIGRIVDGSEALLVDPETLEPVPGGEPGELLGTSPHCVRAYWRKPEESAACFLERDNRIWYRTKDIVRRDEQGWIYFVDRSVDMIKHKGYRIAAAEIERVVQEHPSVIAACCVGVPDPKVGERIKAFVVLKTDVRGISSYELTRWCRDRLAPYKVPHYIEFRDMLPKSKVGKLLRREMRAEEQRKWGM